MAATFPLDTSQPWTYNGVTYKYDAAADMWYAVSSEGSTQLADDLDDLEERVDAIEGGSVNLDAYYTKTEVDQLIDGIDQPDTDLSNYYTIPQVDAADKALQDQIDDLKITKGEPTVYTLNGIGIQVGIRPGDFYVDNAIVKNTSFITLAPQDDNGKERPIGAVGDILEIHGPNNSSYRYTITTIADGTAALDFEIGSDPDAFYVEGTAYSIYIYPQNAESASKDYVDAALANKLSLTGGSLSGTLTTNSLVKSTRTSGYAYLVYDEATETNTAFIHSNGNIRGAAGTFTGDVEIRGISTLKGNTKLEGDLYFTNGGTINVSSGNTVLSGRASLELRTSADHPVVISSGSTYKKVFAIYGYDGSADDNRGETAYINANGQAYFSEVYANDEELATKTYVDGMGQIYYGDISPAGSAVNDGDLWVDSGNMRLLMRAAGAWVNPDREADTLEYRSHREPNGRKFKFSSGTGAATQKLNYYDSGGLKLRLSNTDAFGVKWNDGGIQEDVSMDYGPYFSIWEVVDDNNHKMIRSGRINRIDYHANDILCYVHSHRTNGSFSTSKEYWVSVGGVL